MIDANSLENFKRNIVGREKLTKRANKSNSDRHDHAALKLEIFEKLSDQTWSADDISEYYESMLSNSYRNKEGVYYTPLHICETLLAEIPKPDRIRTFCDPCCGSGNFLLSAYRAGFDPDSIFGFDVDPVAVAIAKRRFFDLTDVEANNIQCRDYLMDMAAQHNNEPRFDAIFTNPPWGKKLSKSDRESYAKKFGAGRSVDSCSLFFFATLKDLKSEGNMGLLLPESFFSISQFQESRKKLLSKEVTALYDFGKPFKGLISKARAFVMKNAPAQLESKSKCYTGKSCLSRNQSSFLRNPNSIINIETSSSDDGVIRRMMQMPHTTLQGNARWGLGIVTGNNKKFCRDFEGPGLMPVYRGAEVHPDKLEGPSTYIPSDLSLYQQVAPKELYEARSKIIYRFISSKFFISLR